MGRTRKQRRQSHGSAWHWKQTDCWYYTLPGTKKRMPLFDGQGQRLRGATNKEAAELALAQLKLAGDEELSAGGNGQGGAREIPYCAMRRYRRSPLIHRIGARRLETANAEPAQESPGPWR